MVTWGWVSDRLGERRWCSAIPSFLAALSLGACVFTDNSVTQMIFIIIAGIGIFGVKFFFLDKSLQQIINPGWVIGKTACL